MPRRTAAKFGMKTRDIYAQTFAGSYVNRGHHWEEN